jgi:hypothetical protein
LGEIPPRPTEMRLPDAWRPARRRNDAARRDCASGDLRRGCGRPGPGEVWWSVELNVVSTVRATKHEDEGRRLAGGLSRGFDPFLHGIADEASVRLKRRLSWSGLLEVRIAAALTPGPKLTQTAQSASFLVSPLKRRVSYFVSVVLRSIVKYD